MSARVVFHTSWAVLATGAIVLDTLARAPTDSGAWVWPFGLVGYALAGALILIHRPGNRVGLLYTLVGVTAGVFSFCYWASLTWIDAPWSPYLEAVGIPGFAVTYWGLIALLYIFPVGTTLPGWRRWLFRIFTAVSIGVLPVGGVLATPVFEEGGSGRPNPLYVEGLFTGDVLAAALVLLAVGAIGGISSLVTRFRRSFGVERAQLKLFLAAAVAFVLIVGLAVGLPESGSDPWWTYAVTAAAFLGLPAAVTAGILRYRLYDIDRVISRTVSYSLVVVVLAGVFFAGVALLTSLLPAQSDLAVAASTLAVAALFSPLRRRVQSMVDRRFNRSKYDIEAEMNALSTRLRESHKQDEITSEMLALIKHTMQPAVFGVWVRSG